VLKKYINNVGSASQGAITDWSSCFSLV
jgi:hypothetical protein